MKKQRPFSAQRTIGITLHNMRKCIDLSISKVFEYVPTAEDPEVSKEIFKTLGTLHKMRNQINDFTKQDEVSK